MTTAGDNITKANIVASMAALSGTYNAGIVWGTNNQPFQTDITGASTSGYSQTLQANISDTNVIASTIVVNFIAYANLLSRIRKVRLLKWYQIQGDVRAQKDYDETNITALNRTYQWDGFAGGPTAGTVIDASDLDFFVNYLSDNINNHRNNTVEIEEFYCHSNCHGSCHGSI